MDFNIPTLNKDVEDARNFLAEKNRITDLRQAELDVASARVHHEVKKTSWFGVQTRMRPNGTTYLMTSDDQYDEREAIDKAKSALDKARNDASEASACLGEAESELAMALHNKAIYDQAAEEARAAEHNEMLKAALEIDPELLSKVASAGNKAVNSIRRAEQVIEAKQAIVRQNNVILSAAAKFGYNRD